MLVLRTLLIALGAAALATAAHADDRIDACRLAAGTVGALPTQDPPGQNDNSVSFAVERNVHNWVGITCVFEPTSTVPQLQRFYWRSFEGSSSIPVDTPNAVLRAHYALPDPDAATKLQQAQMDANQARIDADTAFQCAAWANVDQGRSVAASEVDRLTMYGYDRALVAVASMAGPLAIAADPSHRALYERAPPDFWVGSLWVQSNEAVNRGLEYNVPSADHTFNELQTLRAANASMNFFKQGCDTFGQP